MSYSFLALHSVIHPRAVTEFVYRYSSPKRAFIFLSFYLASVSSRPSAPAAASGASTPALTPQQLREEELSGIIGALKGKGMNALDISDNELAKSHARYLVGGKSKVEHERMFRFEFPERPGALRKFLEGLMGDQFNISLFHYRNHGGGPSSFSFSQLVSTVLTRSPPLVFARRRWQGPPSPSSFSPPSPS